ncbi:putative immunity protein [Herbiconiux sp. A18JL235]|uniref:Immunity protein n=1 Tax=Herbiconiux sp. A18JL235 TaxID=3152363 RepID=A0AB39BC90_9MICO
MPSPQSLSEPDRREVAAWAADCAERVLGLFEAEAPHDDRARDAIARARGFARGERDAAGEIRRRFEAGRAAKSVSSPPAVAAARAAAQASGVAHMGAHALGAAAYAVRAVELSAGSAVEREGAAAREIDTQVSLATDGARRALASLPRVGDDSAGPLGPGLLSTGRLGEIIASLQAGLTSTGSS